MFIFPSIEQIGGRILNKKAHNDAFMNGAKHVEIDVLRTEKLVLPCVPKSHFLFHLERIVVGAGSEPFRDEDGFNRSFCFCEGRIQGSDFLSVRDLKKFMTPIVKRNL